jgi:hypothetical protein
MSLDRWFATTLAGIAMLLHGGVIFGQESDGPAKPTVDAAAKKAGLFHQQVQATPQNPAADSPPRTTKTIPVSAPQPTVSQPVVQQVMLPAQPPTVSVAQTVAMQTAVQQVASPQPQNLFVQSPQHPVASPQSHQVQSAPQQQPQVVQYVQQQPQMVQYVPQQQQMVQAGAGSSPGSALLLRCPGIIDGLLGWLGQGLTSVGQRMASRGAPRQVMALSYNPAYVQVPVAQQVQSVAPQPQVQYVQQPVVSSPPPVTASPQSSQGHHWGLGLFHHD